MSKSVARSLKHATVRRIMSAFAKVESGFADIAVNALFDKLSVEGWSNDAIRPLVEHIATHCPDEDLDLVVEWVEFWRDEAIENDTRQAKLKQLAKLLDISECDAETVLDQHETAKRQAKRATTHAEVH